MKVMSGALLLLIAVVMASFVLRLDATVDKPLIPNAIEEDIAPLPCCDTTCVCTKSIPPLCQCNDVKDHCYPGCNTCRCTRSYPPQCRCGDITYYCPLKCKVKNP